MHSKALVETHLFSYRAKLLDILRLNHEIIGEMHKRWGGGWGEEVLGYCTNTGVEVFELHKIYAVHDLRPPPLCMTY